MQSAKLMMNDPTIREFMSLLEQSDAKRSVFISLMSHIGQIEGQLFEAAKEVTALRVEVAEMREDAKHPLRKALTDAANRLESGMLAAHMQLDSIKAAVLDGAKNAVDTVRTSGIFALNGAMGFLGVKKKMEALRDHLDGCVRSADNSIGKIEKVSTEYHEAGKHLRNVGRALSGKETVQHAKPMGALAKSIRAPFKGARAAFAEASKNAATAVTRLEQLEKTARPSVLGTIRDSRQQQAVRPTGMALDRPHSQPEL
jgi:hypothetical protein